MNRSLAIICPCPPDRYGQGGWVLIFRADLLHARQRPGGSTESGPDPAGFGLSRWDGPRLARPLLYRSGRPDRRRRPAGSRSSSTPILHRFSHEILVGNMGNRAGDEEYKDINYTACMRELEMIKPGVAVREKGSILNWVISWHYLKSSGPRARCWAQSRVTTSGRSASR
jgi:hypothetical protein